MRARLLFGALILAAAAGAALFPSRGFAGPWRQVFPEYQGAYLLSFRSPDLLTDDVDERWGRADRRLVSGGILSDFPNWLREHAHHIEDARDLHRPIILSLHVHSGFGTGLVTYSGDLKRAEVANYPWLIRQLEDARLDRDDVTVTVDTCNAQSAAGHQIRPDLAPKGVEGWAPFQQWRRAIPFRQRLTLASAYRVFAQDHVASHLGGKYRGHRASVTAASFVPLTHSERSDFQARVYGQSGVIIATPALFNVLRLGPDLRGTHTANLLTDRLELRVLDGGLNQNRAEFARFQEFGFLAAAGTPDMDAPVAAEPVERTRRHVEARED